MTAAALSHIYAQGVGTSETATFPYKISTMQTPLLPPPFLAALDKHLERLRLAGRREITRTQRRRIVLNYARSIAPADPLHPGLDTVDQWQSVALRGLCDRSRSNYVQHVSSFYRWLIGEGVMDPGHGATLLHRFIRPSVPRSLPRPVQEATLDMLVANAPARIRPWLVLAGWAGLRAGEVARLTRSDVQDKAATPTLLINGKGGRQRIVPASPFVLTELDGYGMPTRGAVFRRPSDGRQLTPQRLSQVANAYIRSTGVDDTFHSLRHRFATQLYDETGDLRVVQEVLGHSSPSVTALYVAWSDATASEGVSRLRVPTTAGV